MTKPKKQPSRGRPREDGSPLTEKEARFVEVYVRSGSGQQAALDAGFATTERAAHSHGAGIARQPRIARAIAEASARLVLVTDYNLQRAFSDLMEAREFARQNRNPMAVFKCTEALAKLTGHLNDRVDIRVSLPSARLALEEAHARVSLSPIDISDADVISETPRAVQAPSASNPEPSADDLSTVFNIQE